MQLLQELAAAASRPGAAAAGLTPELVGGYMAALHQGRHQRVVEEEQVAMLRFLLQQAGMAAAAAAFMRQNV